MLVAGAGSLWLASFFGTEIYDQNVWKKVYLIMSLFMLIGVFATFVSDEPKIKRNFSSDNHIKFLVSIFISVIGFIFLLFLLFDVLKVF